jgi:hypothetical protein
MEGRQANGSTALKTALAIVSSGLLITSLLVIPPPATAATNLALNSVTIGIGRQVPYVADSGCRTSVSLLER